jgi:hypothetical protein
MQREYLRVDEIATRFGVSVDDVLAACSVVGFNGAHGPDSLIELDLFSQAILTVGRTTRHQPPPNRLRLPVMAMTSLVAALAVLVAVASAFHNDNPARPTSAANGRAAAATYRARVQSLYDATVRAQPGAPDYAAFVEQLHELTPPAGFQAEHTKLVEEAETVASATLAGTPVEAVTPAATALEEDVAAIDRIGATPVRK